MQRKFEVKFRDLGRPHSLIKVLSGAFLREKAAWMCRLFLTGAIR